MRITTYCAFGGALVLSLGLIAAESTTTFASRLAGFSAVPQQTVVDRTNKGDRLGVAATVVPKSTQPTSIQPKSTQPVPGDITSARPRKLLDGCDPLVSPLAGAATAGLTGRCMS
ncbi:MAG: hypothetical protein J0H17_19235 [Rhizobiales bacterium]|nr:hypothetical protein [Hyphomicrobiales bacterium]